MSQFGVAVAALDGALVPAAFVAVTVTAWATPLVSPVMDQKVTPVVVHVCIEPAAVATAV